MKFDNENVKTQPHGDVSSLEDIHLKAIIYLRKLEFPQKLIMTLPVLLATNLITLTLICYLSFLVLRLRVLA